jgi:SagB-type dehydrogenase family enzyme
MSNKNLSPYLFFLLNEGKVICWDYKNHQQFELEKEYFNRLVAISKGIKKSSPIDKDLEEANCIGNFDTLSEWGWDELSKIFHIGTQNIPTSHSVENFSQHINEYLNFCENTFSDSVLKPIEKSGNKIKLPPPNLSLIENQSFKAVLEKRRTYRSFNKTPLSIDLISTLLFCVFGNYHPNDSQFKEFNLQQTIIRKTSPSAGGLHSGEAYLVSLFIDQLDRGIYHYESHSHTLTMVSNDAEINLGNLLEGQHFANNLSAGVFITSRFEKVWKKYPHSRGYRHILLDIGHLSQTFQLCSTALNLHPWLTGAFLDDRVSQLLKIENTTEQPMFFLGVGLGDGYILDAETRKILSERQPTKA